MTTTTPARTRGVSIALWVIQVLLALFFLFAAAGKLMGDPSQVQLFHEIGFGQWFRYLTGTLELLGAIGLVIPRLTALAAAGLTCVMVGATITNLVLSPEVFAVETGLLLVILALLSWARRDSLPLRR